MDGQLVPRPASLSHSPPKDCKGSFTVEQKLPLCNDAADLTMLTQKTHNKLQKDPNTNCKFIMGKMIDYLSAVKHMSHFHFSGGGG